MTKEEGFVQLADADPPWCLQMSHSINFPHPGGSRRQVTYNPVRGTAPGADLITPLTAKSEARVADYSPGTV